MGSFVSVRQAVSPLEDLFLLSEIHSLNEYFLLAGWTLVKLKCQMLARRDDILSGTYITVTE